MSRIDWFNRSKENPFESARRFRQSDPLASRRIAQEAEEPGQEDTLRDSFVPQNLEQPMSAGEQAFETRLAEADQMAARETESAMQLAAAERQAREREDEQQLQQQSQTGQQQSQTGQQGFEVTGEVTGTRRDVLERAGQYVGSPYELGGRTVKGIDCSGLVMSVYSKAGIDVSEHSASWQGRNIPGARTSVDNLQPGDIVAWKDGSHIAIYAGNGMIIDSSSSRGTSQRPLWAPQDQVYGIKLNFPGE